MIGIIGATALGKTKLATQLAAEIGGAVISADSRQVYKGMDIGTGKELHDFQFGNKKIAYYLIDILDAGEEYDVFRFQRDFYRAYHDAVAKDLQPILCGGTGFYIEAAIKDTQFIEVPENAELRKELQLKSLEELQQILKNLRGKLHNSSDLLERNRLVRAIEIETLKAQSPAEAKKSPVKDYMMFGLRSSRPKLHQRITFRLDQRLKNGLIEEVQRLLNAGLDHETLSYYGLEYRYVSLYLQGKMQKNDMRNHLLKAIKQFAKRQETWFRRMEKKGEIIYWLDAEEEVEKNLDNIIKKIGELDG